MTKNLWEDAPIIKHAWEEAPIIKHAEKETSVKDKTFAGHQAEAKSMTRTALSGLSDTMMEKSTFSGLGGATGGAIGGALKGSRGGPFGMIAGGALGAMAGSGIHDAVKTWTTDKSVSLEEQAKNMLKEGYYDALFSMGGAVAQPIRAARAFLGKISGVTEPAAKALLAKADRVKVGLGAVDIGGMFPKAYAKTVGVFPWTGTPFRKGEIAKYADVDRKVLETLDTFGPNKALNDLGIDMVAAAKGTYGNFRQISGVLYTNLNEAIEQASRQDIIPTVRIKEVAADLIDQAQKGAIILEDGTPLPRVAAEGVEKFLSNLPQLPELITPHQFRQLKKDLSDFIGKTLKDGWDVKQLTQIKGALEEGYNGLRIDLLQPGEGEAIQTAQKLANAFYSKGIVQFQTKAAKAFERVDKYVFKAGGETPGSLNADELYNVAVNLKSPMQIRDLTKLVGKSNMKQAASLHFENAVNASRQNISLSGKQFDIIDPFELEKRLGLAGITKDKIGGIKELYKTADVDLMDVTDLIEVMKKIEGIRNPAEFVQRRVIMGGVGALVATGGVGFTGSVGASGLTGLGLTVISRHFSKIFADPRKLKLMVNALDEMAKVAPRRAALGRVIKMITEEEDPGGGPLTESIFEQDTRRPATRPMLTQ